MSQNESRPCQNKKPDPISPLNGTALNYDTDGNLLGGPLPNGAWGNTGSSSGATGTFAWDVRNRLTGVTRSGSGQVISYGYDAEGFLVGITTGGQTERLTVDPHGGRRSQVLVRNYPTGNPSRYVYGLGLLYEEKPDGSLRVFHYDSLGSTVALTDGAGAITGRVQYGTFGAVATSSGDGLATPFLWHGRHGVWTDKNTGLHQMRARWYSSALRRFLNPDPAGFAGGSNFYLYANGDPVSMIDPFGLCGGKPDEGNGFLVGSLLNGDMIEGYSNLYDGDQWGTLSGFGYNVASGIGQIIGVADAIGNVITGKGLVKGGVKAVVGGGTKVVAADFSKLAIAASDDAAELIAKNATELHHLLPRSKKLKTFFENAGLNVEDFKIALDKAKHRLKPNGIHTGNFEDSWNGVWTTYFKNAPNASKSEILEQLAKMRDAFGI